MFYQAIQCIDFPMYRITICKSFGTKQGIYVVIGTNAQTSQILDLGFHCFSQNQKFHSLYCKKHEFQSASQVLW